LREGQLGDFDAVLSNDERDRAARFHFEKDRNRFRVARTSLRTILGRYLRLPPAALEFSQTEYGKPFLKNSSAKDLRFNLSHSRDVALIAVTRGQDVGVDVEYMRPDFATKEVAKHFFSPRERDDLSNVPGELQTGAFYNCWTRKEAYIKARGEGVSLQLDSFDVSLAPDCPAALLDSRLHPDDVARWKLAELFPATDYAAALAVARDTSQIRLWQFTLAE